MALNLSQLLGGAGVAAGSMRQAEEAERVARQNQLVIEERNRLDQLRVAQEALSRSMESPAPAFRFDMGTLPVRQIAVPTPAAAPAAPSVAPPMLREQAAFLEANVAYPPAGRGEVPPTPVAAATQSLNTLEDQKVQLMKQLREASGGGRGRAAIYKQIDDINRQIAAARSQVTQAQRATGVTGIRVPTPAPAAAAPAAAAPAAAAPAGLALTANDAIARVLQREGGYVNDPADTGGETNFGISKRAYPNLDIPNLTPEQAAAIYKRDYWDAINADQLPANIRELAFDAAVNQGVGWTKGALAQAGNDPQQFMQLREARYRDIVAANPSQQKFLAGWMNRLRDLAGGVVGTMVPSAQAAPTAAVPAAPAAGAPATGAAPVQVKSSAIYLKNPDAITQDMRVAMQQRDYMAKLARLYENAGMGPQALEVRAKVMEMDNSMIFLQGMRGIEEFSLAGDPRRLAAVWSAYFGAPVGVQRRSDGLFDVIADGERVLEGLSANAVVDRARSSFDTAFRKQKAEAAATAGMEEFKSVLRRQEQQGKDLAQMIREIAVERVRGNNAQALEWAKNNYGWDIRPTGSGDGTVIIRPPGGSPYLFNPSGKTIEIDGVKVQSNAAYPIAGLPTYGGVQPNR